MLVEISSYSHHCHQPVTMYPRLRCVKYNIIITTTDQESNVAGMKQLQVGNLRAESVVQYLRFEVPFSKAAPKQSAHPKSLKSSLMEWFSTRFPRSRGESVTTFLPPNLSKPAVVSTCNIGHESAEAAWPNFHTRSNWNN